jgi:hypothetical protein
MDGRYGTGTTKGTKKGNGPRLGNRGETVIDYGIVTAELKDSE